MSQPVNPYEAPKASVIGTAEETQPVRIFSVSGRIGRARYVVYGIGFLLPGYFMALALALAGAAPLPALIMLGIIAIGFILTIQRCHDFAYSGWLALLFFVPAVNLVFWLIPGTQGPNRYGPPTPPTSIALIVAAWLAPVFAVFFFQISFHAYDEFNIRRRAQQPEANR